ncbi:MAG: YidC/Oxa1 family rane protein insertase [Sphingomonadales bacterium]|nr:YidC/Oxa1 family rane protein insertase [Sphingomonadales bacterium]
MSNDNRNMILAIVLSAIVLLGWGLVTQSFMPANPPPTKSQNGNQVAAPQPQAVPAPAAPRPTLTRDIVVGASRGRGERIAVRTPRLEGTINLVGARIDDLVLTRHRDGIGRDSHPIRLFSPEGTPGAYHASFGWTGPAGIPTTGTLWKVTNCARDAQRPVRVVMAVPPRIPGPATATDAAPASPPAAAAPICDPGRVVLTPEQPLTLSWDNQRGQIYQIVLRVDDGYLFTAEQSVVNRGAPVVLGARALVNRVGVSHDPTSWTSHVGPVGLFNGSANYGYDFSTVAEAGAGGIANNSHGGWLGFTDKYWLTAIVPDQGANVATAFHHLAGDAYQAEFSTPVQAVGPGHPPMRTTSYLFAGAKEIALLDRYTASLGTDLGRSIDWGWFDFIMKPIFALLMWLFAQLGNFGVAIIFLVIIVRLILFPLAQKQFASMAKMRVLQPKVKALQARYAADKPRLQQEMLKLYKEEKVNPMAGCLPIFLQIPIFYALYKVLLISVEMRHQPFALWIKDLTAPDPLTPINLFGLLPFQPPGIIAIGILPILVGVTMWLQQKMNSAPMDPTQQKIFAWMPWILVVIMAPFAAGFQVYWVTNNLISILQIWFLNRKMDATAAARGKPGVALGKAKASPPPDSPPPPPPPPPRATRPKARPRPRRK